MAQRTGKRARAAAGREAQEAGGFDRFIPDEAAGDEPPPHYHGHRQRLRERFRSGGAEALPDYELLELLLFAGIPRVDVKPLAKEMLAHFGGFAQLASADRAALRGFRGMTDSAVDLIHAVREAAVRLTREQVVNRPVLGSWKKVLDYCMAAMGSEPVEQFRILFLDRKNVLIKDERQARGTVDHTPVYPREVVKRALELGASAIILVHNHPSGDPTPSRADIEMTEAIVKAAGALGIAVHDHLVIGKSGHASLKGMGLM